MNKKLHILQHALGLDQYGQGEQYRSHFVTGHGSDDFDNCRELVAEGLMIERPPSDLTGGDSLFIVTPNGIDFVALHSPKAPKKTRSQIRYQEYLKSSLDCSFGNYLKYRSK